MNSKTIPTPYMWSYQPQSGRAAGAAQDYSTRLNWFGAGPGMIAQVYGLREEQNRILMTQAEITETPRRVLNPPTWPAHLLPQNLNPPVTIELPRNESLENTWSNSGAQLAGGYRVPVVPPIRGSIRGGEFFGGAIELNEKVGISLRPRPDGLFQLGGGSRSSFGPTEAYLTLQQRSSVPRSGGVGAEQFVREFVPEVYLNPYSGPPSTFPNQFMPNYDIVTDSVNGYE